MACQQTTDLELITCFLATARRLLVQNISFDEIKKKAAGESWCASLFSFSLVTSTHETHTYIQELQPFSHESKFYSNIPHTKHVELIIKEHQDWVFLHYTSIHPLKMQILCAVLFWRLLSLWILSHFTSCVCTNSAFVNRLIGDESDLHRFSHWRSSNCTCQLDFCLTWFHHTTSTATTAFRPLSVQVSFLRLVFPWLHLLVTHLFHLSYLLFYLICIPALYLLAGY